MPKVFEVDEEILTNKEKICLLHGFVIGLMTGHNDTRIEKPDYVDIEYKLIEKLDLINSNITNDFITKLQEMDIFTIYKKLN